MTTGQLIFYSGIGLFVLAVLLMIVFSKTKPVYHPSQYSGIGGEPSSAPVHTGKTEFTDNGATQFDDGATQLDDGVTQFDDGATQLDDGVTQFDDGATQLDDGATQLDI